ncbi:MAG: hypothetical protein ACSNEK_05275 [Parachlamydiaceae bacterium]
MSFIRRESRINDHTSYHSQAMHPSNSSSAHPSRNQSRARDQIVPKIALPLIADGRPIATPSISSPHPKREQPTSHSDQLSYNVSPRSPGRTSGESPEKVKKKFSLFKSRKRVDENNFFDFFLWQKALTEKVSKEIAKQAMSRIDAFFQEKQLDYFFLLFDEIGYEVTKEVLQNSEIIGSVMCWLRSSLGASKKLSENIERLLTCQSLIEFSATFISLLSEEERRGIAEHLGGEEFILFINDWRNGEEVKNRIRNEIVSLIEELFDVVKLFNRKALPLPQRVKYPKLNNEQVQRSWFPNAICLPAEVLYNSKLVEFKTISTTAPHEAQKECLKANFQHLVKSLELSDNSGNVIENILSEPAQLCEFPELILQTAEISAPIMIALYKALNKVERNKFRFNTEYSTCHYERKGDELKFTQTKTCKLNLNGKSIGSFSLSWTFSLTMNAFADPDAEVFLPVVYEYTIKLG